MKRAALALCLALAAGAHAEPWTGPIFDAHLHYNDDAVPIHSVGSVFELFRKNGVGAILANSGMLAMSVVMQLAMNVTMLRDPIETRVRDVLVPVSLMMAWLAGFGWRRA